MGETELIERNFRSNRVWARVLIIAEQARVTDLNLVSKKLIGGSVAVFLSTSLDKYVSVSSIKTLSLNGC